MTYRHSWALGCLFVFCVNSISFAGEPNSILSASFWIHNEYGVSHAQQQDVPFLCLWDTYCQRHGETHADICQHQYLVDAGGSKCRACPTHCVTRLCGNSHSSGGHYSTLAPAPLQRLPSHRGPAPLTELTTPSAEETQPAEEAAPDKVDSALPSVTDGNASDPQQPLPPNELPANAIPETTRGTTGAKLPNWVSWLSD